MFLRVAAACALAVAGATACKATDNASHDDVPGDSATAAPAFYAVSLVGDTVTLKGLQGQVVLLNIWATWCIPCREEMPALQRIYSENKERGLTVVGVSIDARGAEERVGRFARDLSITFPIWLDPDERATYAFRAIGVPATYMISREGTIVWKKLGPISEDDADMAKALEAALR
jgi:cytochrome c-type biogenesis protein